MQWSANAQATKEKRKRKRKNILWKVLCGCSWKKSRNYFQTSDSFPLIQVQKARHLEGNVFTLKKCWPIVAHFAPGCFLWKWKLWKCNRNLCRFIIHKIPWSQKPVNFWPLPEKMKTEKLFLISRRIINIT